MAHYAKIGLNNKVIQTVVLENKYLLNADGVEDERVGQEYLERHNSWPAELWIQTSFNTFANQHRDGGTPFRGNYGIPGYTWDEENSVFWPPQPYPSWTKNLTNFQWDPPVARPALTAEQQARKDAGTHNYDYIWDEDNQSWTVDEDEPEVLTEEQLLAIKAEYESQA